MRKLILFLLFITVQPITSQEKPADAQAQSEKQIYSAAHIEFKPEYPGGIPEFNKYIIANYKMPREKGLEGKVIVSFVVDVDGSLTDIQVIRDIGYDTGKEAIRVLSQCPKWKPGEQDGKKVRVRYSLPINVNTK